MLKIGLTGNMGSGKTTVAMIFSIFGIPVYQADLRAKMFLSDVVVVEKLKSRFGKEIYSDNKLIDKKKLAAIVFNNKKQLDFLNKLIHPLVINDYANWLEEHSKMPYTIHEAAVIYENNLQKHFDKTVLVTCPEQLLLNRIKKRDHLEEMEIKARLSKQWEQEKKMLLCNFSINNDGKHSLIRQVFILDNKLRKISENSNI